VELFDLGLGGLGFFALVAEEKMITGRKELSVRLTLGAEELSFLAEIRWNKLLSASNPQGIKRLKVGVRFINPRETDLAKIQDFLSRLGEKKS